MREPWHSDRQPLLSVTLTLATHFTAAITDANIVRTQPAVMGNGVANKQLHNACPTYLFLGSNPTFESICIPELKFTLRLC
jgi:hypothetical protein